MLWRLVGLFAVAATLWLRPAQLSAYVAPTTGCHHNGSWFADKSLVPTMEKCLNCQCNKKTLVCRLKVCPEMPMPPPRGCVVVQKKSTCCPYLSCARLEAFYKIPITRRIIQYLDHYERESIDRVVNENMLQRRSDDSDTELHVCVKNGTVYKSGSAMSSSNLCSYCYCIGGSEKCVKPKCMLPVDGCKPIFVDSTCCPVRYDCSAKASGKSSQEVRYRKTSNKHFLRMSQRLQRNRGCSAGNQFYAEGQKMKSDPDKPCDICFCIRGQRRCAPKKCSPALKNCIPVVPKGQCCPSSYDCGSQRDYRRSHNSRQFNLYSFIFGKDGNENEADGGGENHGTEIPVQYPHDRQPPADDAGTQAALQSPPNPTSEKSIFDTIREGLEFIDGNNDKLLEENIDLLAANDPLRSVVSLPPPSGSSTEESLLDLIFGPIDALKKEPNKVEPINTDDKTTTTGYDDVSWVDLLIGEEELENKNSDTTISDKFDTTEATTSEHSDYGTTNVDRIGEEFDDFSGDGEILVTDDMDDFSTETDHTTHKLSSQITENSTKPTTTTTTTTPATTTTTKTRISKPVFRPIANIKRPEKPQNLSKPSPALKTTEPIISSTHSSVVAPQNPTEQFHKTDTNNLESLPLKSTTENQTDEYSNHNSLLSAFIDGLSSVLDIKPETTVSSTISSLPPVKTKHTNKQSTTTTTPKITTSPNVHIPIILPTPKPLPQFKPLPTIKSHIRINSKLANLTTNPPLLTTKLTQNSTNFNSQETILVKSSVNKTTTITSNSTFQTTTTTTTKTPALRTTPTITPKSGKTTTLPPLVISTNPTILEAEPLDSVVEPTLPPSLPNLKIIPFLPTDAVKTDRNQPPSATLYGDFYNSPKQTSRIDYDTFDEGNIYPPITERFPSFSEEHDDDTKAEYIYKFNVEGPVAVPVAAAAPATTGIKYGLVGDVTEVELEVGMPAKQGFSPPTKTEGGFVPKESFVIGADGELHEHLLSEGSSNHQVTQHIIDITTAEPFIDNDTKIIEFTTPDPFKDVIRTEPPPDLTSFIDHNAVNKTKPKPKPTAIQTPAMNNSSFNQSKISPNKLLSINETKAEQGNDASKKQTPLDLLLQNKTDNYLSSTSTVPPFKSLPVAMHIHNLTKITTTLPTPHTETTTTTLRSASKPASKLSATTKRPVASKSPSKHRVKPVRPSIATVATDSNSSNVEATTKTTKSKINTTHAVSTRTTRKPIAHKTTTTTTTTRATPTSNGSSNSTTVHPFLMSPFDKLPFMDPSFEVRPYPVAIASTEAAAESVPSIPQNEVQNTNHYLNLLDYKNTLNKYEGLEPIYDNDFTTMTTTTTTTTTSSPKPQYVYHSLTAAAQQHQQQQHTTATNSLIDPTGLVKLDACNIYGRMYRVGSIIVELSSACLECKCTGVGVKCGPLDC